MPAGLESKKGAGSYELDMTTLYVHYGGAGHYAQCHLRHLLLQVMYKLYYGVVCGHGSSSRAHCTGRCWLPSTGPVNMEAKYPCHHDQQLCQFKAAPCSAVLQNFGEWGPVKRIHIVPTKTIAFIKYHWRVSAEFAREAMDQQQLTGSTLNEVGMEPYASI